MRYLKASTSFTVAISLAFTACEKKTADSDSAKPPISAPKSADADSKPPALDKENAAPILTNLLEDAVKDRMSRSKKNTAIVYVHKLSNSLNLYELINKLPPSTAQGLQSLVQRPAGDPQPQMWRQAEEKIELDPWGHEYRYEVPGRHNKDGFDVYSCGPDGKPGTDDDIGNW